MNLKKTLFPAAVLLAAVFTAGAQDNARGYYKDIFMDSGIMLTSRTDLPVTDLLGLSMEAFVSTKHVSSGPQPFTPMDTLRQRELITGSPMDENGILLYPDGAPRFRMIYMNGGKAAGHGRSLEETGRQHYRDFLAAGGSYVGSCAGAFIASLGSRNAEGKISNTQTYIGLWPGNTMGTRLEKSYTAVDIVPNGPLTRYFDFDGRMHIDSVRHNGGCFASTAKGDMPQGTEVLLRYDFDDSQRAGKQKINGEIACWAYKGDKKSGRLVVIGSHPEIKAEGENLDLFKSILLYALDSGSHPEVKGELKKGEIRFMKKGSGDHDPRYACIGDLQYHHFTVNIPNKARNIRVILRCKKEGIDMNLTMRKGDFAFADRADYKDLTPGASKTLSFDSLPGGTWYIGVECATTVETVATDCGVEYTGHTEVLNGIPYSIQVTWD